MEFNYKSESDIVQAIRKREDEVFEYLKAKCFGPEINEFTGEELDHNVFSNLFWRNFKKQKHYCSKPLIESVQKDPDFEEFRKNLEGEENNYSL